MNHWIFWYFFLIFLTAGRAGLAWGLSLAILFVCIVIAVIFYYRRRVSNLKTEIQHVQYISDPSQGWPDRHNFDNPVYGLQGADARLLNNLQPKMNNLDRNIPVYGDDSNASSRGKINEIILKFLIQMFLLFKLEHIPYIIIMICCIRI